MYNTLANYRITVGLPIENSKRNTVKMYEIVFNGIQKNEIRLMQGLG